ncbi:MAG: class I SAM-dependent methyltransferase, partial [Gaiella sp.]
RHPRDPRVPRDHVTHAEERHAQIEAWRAVAGGWERQRHLVWDATRAVSERLVELLDPSPGEQLLEVAAGPGDTGLLAVPRLRPGGRLVSTDAVPEMVEAARRRAAELGVVEAEFVVADAIELPFPDGAFDAALCRFGVMLVPDCVAAARELARVLRPDGRAAVAVWAEGDRNLWITAAGRAAVRLGVIEPPAADAPGPFRLAEPGRLRGVLELGGLAVTLEAEVDVVWRAASLDEWWAISLDTSRLVGRLAEEVDAATLARVRASAQERLAPFVVADGSLAVPGVARVALAERRRARSSDVPLSTPVDGASP